MRVSGLGQLASGAASGLPVLSLADAAVLMLLVRSSLILAPSFSVQEEAMISPAIIANG